ncbi:MAG: hypothetical protein CMJ48_00530 [Planctomycetaceae bacterium]|nr:hypothetical protein [Planctomycetaceae bacterium]
MSFLSNATDDQLALMGCGVALAVSFGLMFVSFYFGKARRNPEQFERTSSIRIGERPNAPDPGRRSKVA